MQKFMPKLTDLFLEDTDKDKKVKTSKGGNKKPPKAPPQTAAQPASNWKPDPNIPSMKNLAKQATNPPKDPALADFPDFDNQTDEKPFGDPEFGEPNIKQPEKEKDIPSLTQLAKQADDEEEDSDLKDFPKFTGDAEEDPFAFTDEPNIKKKEPYSPSRFAVQEPDKPAPGTISKKAAMKGNMIEPDPSIPSLSQLAADIDGAPSIEQDPDLDGLPNFKNMGFDVDNENPFGDPDAGNNDFRTTAQKGVDAIGQGIKKGADLAKKGFSKLTKKSDEVPSNWKPGDKNSNQEEPEDDKMPSMASVAKSNEKPAKPSSSKQLAKHWHWKPGQKVDIGFVKGLTVLDVDQHGARLKAKNGGIYRFIPHRGLRKIG